MLPRPARLNMTPWRRVIRVGCCGDHELVVRRIGYGTTHAIVRVKPAWRTDVEAYLAQALVGIAPPPPRGGRVNVTTCE